LTGGVGATVVVFEAYMDDSVTEGGTFVLGGYIASAEAWAEFSKEWEALLPLATRSKTGKLRFKMSEMTARMDNVRAFYNVIEKYVALKLSCKIEVSALKHAIDRIWMERVSIVYGDWNNPYFVCFRGLMDLFHEARFDERTTKIIPVDKKVDFILINTHLANPYIWPGKITLLSAHQNTN
jgi:hypothetical protein